MDLSDVAFRRRLSLVRAVVTPVHRVVNAVVAVKRHSVVVRSARTGRSREIPFDHIRRAGTATANGSLVRALARVVGVQIP